MHFWSISILPLILQAVAAKRCVNQTVSIAISSRNGIFGKVNIPQSNADVVNVTLLLAQQGHNFTQAGLSGYKTISGIYEIATQLCSPEDVSIQRPAIQVLTHGIGFDRTYWDLPLDDYRYSYVNNAVDKHNFYTLTYDRLGLGQSQHGEPRDEIQTFLEIESLKALTRMLRDGSFPGIKHKFCKIVHVGHSFGSAQTYGLTATDRSVSDGIVLTGYSANFSFLDLFVAGGNFQEAALNDAEKFGEYPHGYLVTSDKEALTYQHLLPGYYDPDMLTLLEGSKQPVTLGELLTIGSSPKINAFAGPVLVFTGSNDVPYCGGDCQSHGGYSPASIPGGVAQAFPYAKEVVTYIQPNTGHGITAHFNSTAGFDVIAQFLVSRGLGPG